MKNLNLMTLLTYMMYVKNYRITNVDYNSVISNIKENNATKERSTSEPKHISDVIENWKYHFHNHTL